MKIVALFILVIAAYFYVSNESSEGLSEQFNQEMLPTATSCQRPNNPFNNGGGHYAGFEWAKDKGQSCSGNSTSFVDGCEEYYQQLKGYKQCQQQ
jgi:hypothetical protein